MLNTHTPPSHWRQQPWVTGLSVAACVLLYLVLLFKNAAANPALLEALGSVPADALWRGHVWGLWTSVFVHLELWHVAFNAYGLWTLGRLMERAIGSLAFLAFFLGAAFVSSSFQLAFTDSTGIGASGVVYALFGFMWITREKYPEFALVLSDRTVRFFIVWLFGCVLATMLKLWEVGNEAHAAGLVFGIVCATLHLRYRPALTGSALLALVALATVFLFWCPWSETWLSTKAYAAHTAGRYSEAQQLYAKVLERNPKSAWAYLNRSLTFLSQGKRQEAEADLQKARELDPTLVNETYAGQ